MNCEDLKKYDVVVDCRTEHEYLQGHIEGAVLIPINDFTVKYEILNKDDNIAIYCRSGLRANAVVEFLTNENYTTVTNVGGISQYVGCIKN